MKNIQNTECLSSHTPPRPWKICRRLYRYFCRRGRNKPLCGLDCNAHAVRRFKNRDTRLTKEKRKEKKRRRKRNRNRSLCPLKGILQYADIIQTRVCVNAIKHGPIKGERETRHKSYDNWVVCQYSDETFRIFFCGKCNRFPSHTAHLPSSTFAQGGDHIPVRYCLWCGRGKRSPQNKLQGRTDSA